MLFGNDFPSSEAEEVEKDDSYNLELENRPEDFNEVSSDEEPKNGIESDTWHSALTHVAASDSNSLSSLSSLSSLNTENRYDNSKSYSCFEVDHNDKEVERKTKGQVIRRKDTADESNTIADTIINAFIVKRRKALVDQEEFEIDIVSYETSEKRLIVLAAILSFFLCLIISILLAPSVANWQQNNVLILDPTLTTKQPSKKHPYVVLLFKNGTLEFFGLNRTKLNHSWSFKVPSTKKNTGYFPFVRKNVLNIIYSDKQKEATVISGKSMHHTIKESKIPSNFFYYAETAQFGNLFWIIGGQNELHYGDNNNHGQTCNSPPNFNTLIWNTRKHKYYPGPTLYDNILAYGCPVALNRTQVLIFHQGYNDNCIYAMVYDFERFIWAQLNHCYYNITVEEQLSSHDIFQLRCTSILGKKNIKIFVMAQSSTCKSSLSAVDFAIIDLPRKISVRVPNTLVNQDLHYYSSIESLSINGMLYLISSTTEGMENTLQVHLLQNETLFYKQSIQVQPYLANKVDQVVNAKDFNAIPLLF